MGIGRIVRVDVLVAVAEDVLYVPCVGFLACRFLIREFHSVSLVIWRNFYSDAANELRVL